jgi:hypothetical protein
VVLVFFGLDFWRCITMAASSKADLTSAIQYVFNLDKTLVGDGRS